ncbi:hypothetical protein GMMP15_1110002 [Candidatus Magnetomoraceae bacterium gMMP-15]
MQVHQYTVEVLCQDEETQQQVHQYTVEVLCRDEETQQQVHQYTVEVLCRDEETQQQVHQYTVEVLCSEEGSQPVTISTITGIIKENGEPVEKTACLFQKTPTWQFVEEKNSGADGSFSFSLPRPSDNYVVIFPDYTVGDSYTCVVETLEDEVTVVLDFTVASGRPNFVPAVIFLI